MGKILSGCGYDDSVASDAEEAAEIFNNENGYSMLQKPFTRNQLLKTIEDALADN